MKEYDEYYSTDNKLKDPETLSEHILKQVAPSVSSNERKIAEHVLARLNEHGFLIDHPAEIASYLRVSLDKTKNVIEIIKRVDLLELLLKTLWSVY